jgi:hypothetical protein
MRGSKAPCPYWPAAGAIPWPIRHLLIVRFRSPAKSAVTMRGLHADPVSEIRVEKILMGKQKSMRGALIDLKLAALN